MSCLKVGFLIPLVIVFGGFERMSSTVSAAPIEDSSIGGTGSSSETKIKEVGEAATRFRNSDFEGAKALLDAAIKQHKELPPAALIMAQWFAQVKQGTATRNWLEQAVVEVPDDPEAYVILGDLNRRERRWTEASLLYDKAMEKLKSFKGSEKRSKALTFRTRKGLASVAEAQRKLDDAETHLNAILAVDPKSTEALQQLGRVLFLKEKPTDALKKFQAAHDADENVLTPEAILAQLFEATGDRENATKWMIEALNVAPRDLRTRLVATRWALQAGMITEAQEQAIFALDLDPKSLDAQILRGVVALFVKDHDTAAEFFQKALIQSPDNFAAKNNLALSLCELDKPEEKKRALTYARQNIERNQKSSEAFSTFGWVLYRAGNIDNAEQALQKAVQLSGGQLSPDTAFYIGQVSADRDRVKDAIQLLESALQTTRPFSMRPESEKLLEELKKRPVESKKDDS